jgi:hypothetical protein
MEEAETRPQWTLRSDARTAAFDAVIADKHDVENADTATVHTYTAYVRVTRWYIISLSCG